ncbi:MAG TPA: hypothetical protein VMB21_15155, partial [Candidatus Limnocylindria bacterium]|nr:hypothetical protein [Candidatus Limnocylindria bacterium]
GVQSTNLVLAGGTFTDITEGTGALFGQTLWTGGQFAGTFAHRGVLTVAPTGRTAFTDGTAFVNTGTVQGAGTILATNATFSNKGIVEGVMLTAAGPGSALPVFNNGDGGGIVGLYRRDPAVPTNTVGRVQFNDKEGTIDANGGVIDFAGGHAAFFATKFVGDGTVLISSDASFGGIGVQSTNLVLAGGTFTDITEGTGALFGQTLWTGGQFAGTFAHRGILAVAPTGRTAFADGTKFINSGTVQGAGTIFATNATFNNSGVIIPGAPFGRLNLGGDLNQSGTLRLKIGGATSNQFGSLSVFGTLSLGGTLGVALTNGFMPEPGSEFPIISCSKLNGKFASLSLPFGMSAIYSDTGVTLKMEGSAPVQIFDPTFTEGKFGFSFDTENGLNYVVQQNDDLTSSNWLFYTNIPGNGLPIQIFLPVTNNQGFFRLLAP